MTPSYFQKTDFIFHINFYPALVTPMVLALDELIDYSRVCGQCRSMPFSNSCSHFNE